MAKLTPKQQKFCDEYITSLNAAEAAVNAGYSEKTARQIGSRLLTNVNVKEYIAKRVKSKQNDLIMKQDEILETYTNIARNDEVSIKDRLKALDSLSKTYSLFSENINIDAKVEETIKVELPKEIL